MSEGCTIVSHEMQPCCLTVAGSDSGGNAGVQADLRAFHCYGLHGCTAIAALTAQNPHGVSAVQGVSPEFVAAQLDAVLGVYNVRAMKTGILSDPAVVEVVTDRLAGHGEIAKVVDPVMIATSGARLASQEAVTAMIEMLFPLAALVTPNLPEAEVICGVDSASAAGRAADVARARDLARRIFEKHGCAALVKGGHGTNSSAVDVLYDGEDFAEFSMPWVVEPVSTHGTGCSLAAALAAELALGRKLRDAVAGAKRYVHAAIVNGFSVGRDCGVLGFVDMK